MATIMETVIDFAREHKLGLETHPNGVLEIHTPPHHLAQCFIKINPAGPYQYKVEMWHSTSFTDRPFWTETGTANWQWVHDELIAVVREISQDWADHLEGVASA